MKSRVALSATTEAFSGRLARGAANPFIVRRAATITSAGLLSS
jgi:hypothetical protein